jgi:hypothetical protein
MKTIFTSTLLLLCFCGFAQTQTKPKTTTTATTTSTTTQTATTATTLSPKGKALCKNWSLSMTENFGDQHKPNDTQKNDQLVLMDNGMYRLTKDGVAQTGTWTLDKSNVWLTLTNMDGTTMKWQILESTDNSLKVDYRDSDQIHNILYYSTSATQSK